MGSRFLGDLKPDSALRNIDLEEGSKLDHHRLFASTYYTTGNGWTYIPLNYLVYGTQRLVELIVELGMALEFSRCVVRLTRRTQSSYGVNLFLGPLCKEIAMQPSVYRKRKSVKFKISPVSAVPPACNCVVVGADMKITKSATGIGFVKS